MSKGSARNCIRTGLPLLCLLISGVYAAPVYSEWSVRQQPGYYNGGYGDFPPQNINEIIHKEGLAVQEESEQDTAASNQAASQPAIQSPAAPPAVTPTAPGYPARNYSGQQAPYRGAYGRGPNVYPGANAPYYNRGSAYSSPGYRGSNFSGPWNNNRSNFNAPWNNNSSGFSGPWNNNGSNFSGPWNNNNGTSFNAPWNNNGSSFSPWGGRGGWW